MRLPDGLRSRVVMVGTSRYQDSQLPDLPAVSRNIDDLQRVLTGDHGVGIPARNCVAVLDARDPGLVWTALQDAADDADDLLVVYYAGHGVLDRRGRLYLGLPATARDTYRWTALDISHIREVMADSAAANRVLILDCCFSGRAYEAMGGFDAAALATGQVEISGTYTLTSTSANTPAHAPVGERYTAFTGALLDLLERGVTGGPELLTLDDIYRNLRRLLRARNAPAPERKGTNNVGDLALVRNPALQSHNPSARHRLEDGTALFIEVTEVGELGRSAEAVKVHEELITGNGDDSTSALRERVASAVDRTWSVRDAVLQWLYLETMQGTRMPTLNASDVGMSVGWAGAPFTDAEVNDASLWLRERGLLDGQGVWGGGIVRPRITPAGEQIADPGKSVRGGDGPTQPPGP
ncbi:caspase family protein [Nocardia vinacea]|uniref:caspase family protein n=1 Tax=Nocardia vinacea TaxID=96468 RepID=UPI003438D02C